VEKYQRQKEAMEEDREDTLEQPTPGSRGPEAKKRKGRREELLSSQSAFRSAVLLPV
jgi:hypothetical protein